MLSRVCFGFQWFSDLSRWNNDMEWWFYLLNQYHNISFNSVYSVLGMEPGPHTKTSTGFLSQPGSSLCEMGWGLFCDCYNWIRSSRKVRKWGRWQVIMNTLLCWFALFFFFFWVCVVCVCMITCIWSCVRVSMDVEARCGYQVSSRLFSMLASCWGRVSYRT